MARSHTPTAARFTPLLVARVIAAALIATPTFAADPAESPARPNILLIMSDDMGYSDIGCYGGEIATPTLDSLAAGGVRFTQFYNTGRCCPTRASLLTGLYPHQAGMGHMTSDQRLPGYTGVIGGPCATIAEVLRPAGYGTYMVGKWHVTRHDGPNGPKDDWPLHRGFDKFYGTIKGGGNFFDPTALCRGDTFITPVNDPHYKPDVYYYTDAISDNAISFLREHRKAAPDKPLFMYVAYTAAHWPMHALPRDIAQYEGKYDGGYEPIRAARFERLKKLGLIAADAELTPQAGDWAKVPDDRKAWEAACMEVYAAMVDRMDQGIGRIVAELEAQGKLENTLILYLQDNGGCAENMGRNKPSKPYPTDLKPLGPDELQPAIWPPMQTRDGRPVRHGPGVMPGPADTYIAYGEAWANVSNTPFREYKHYVHEGGVATPLIVHWPAGVKRRGELVRAPGHLIDIMATCVDVAGATYPAERDGKPITPMQGVSLMPAMSGGALDRKSGIYFEHEGNRAMRDGRWKLVAEGAGGAWELYDMEADRGELHNLAAEEPQRVSAMASAWEAWAKEANVVPWPWKPQYGQSKAK